MIIMINDYSYTNTNVDRYLYLNTNVYNSYSM